MNDVSATLHTEVPLTGAQVRILNIDIIEQSLDCLYHSHAYSWPQVHVLHRGGLAIFQISVAFGVPLRPKGTSWPPSSPG